MTFEFTLTALQKRIAAVSLAAILPLCAILILLSAISDWREHHARMTTLVRERKTYRQLVDGMPGQVDAFMKLKASGIDQSLFPATTPASNSEQIRNRVSNSIKGACGSPGRARVGARAGRDTPVVIIQADIVFACDIEGLTKVLHQFASARPLLVVDKLRIDDLHRGIDAWAPLHAPNQLQIELVVSGFMRAP
jgi:Type II secretion system (T2SS), protein M subtype b